jgi:hypothetical protein
MHNGKFEGRALGFWAKSILYVGYMLGIRVVSWTHSVACGATNTAKDAKLSGWAGRFEFVIVDRSTKSCPKDPARSHFGLDP